VTVYTQQVLSCPILNVLSNEIQVYLQRCNHHIVAQ
jgi:hypothetical protein